MIMFRPNLLYVGGENRHGGLGKQTYGVEMVGLVIRGRWLRLYVSY